MSRVCGNSIGARPYQILPPSKDLRDIAIGNLLRRKIQSKVESGDFRKTEYEDNNAIKSYRVTTRQAPSSKTEKSALEIVCEILHVPVDETGIGVNIFKLGITSVSLFAFRQNMKRLSRKWRFY